MAQDRMTARDVQDALRCVANAEKAAVLKRFFKTGPGEYGDGDRFLGVVVPEQRQIMRRYFAGVKERSCGDVLQSVGELLRSEFHEDRLTGLLILVEQYRRSDERDRELIFGFYMKHMRRINNWDLVDLSAPNIVGQYLMDKDCSVLFEMAESSELWTRRIAVLATHAFIKSGRYSEILELSERLLMKRGEAHDLMQKAVGWMLREVGKRDATVLMDFLDRHAAGFPRTALRYAIERFPEPVRQRYLRAGK